MLDSPSEKSHQAFRTNNNRFPTWKGDKPIYNSGFFGIQNTNRLSNWCISRCLNSGEIWPMALIPSPKSRWKPLKNVVSLRKGRNKPPGSGFSPQKSRNKSFGIGFSLQKSRKNYSEVVFCCEKAGTSYSESVFCFEKAGTSYSEVVFRCKKAGTRHKEQIFRRCTSRSFRRVTISSPAKRSFPLPSSDYIVWSI